MQRVVSIRQQAASSKQAPVSKHQQADSSGLYAAGKGSRAFPFPCLGLVGRLVIVIFRF
jgi:hypothetical protein